MRFKLAALCAGIALFAAAPAFAGTISYNFAGADSVVTSPATYTVSGISIIAYGQVAEVNHELYQKADGTGENGLGLNGTLNNEINPTQEIVLDLTNLVSAGYTNGTLTLESLQSGEEGQVCVATSLSNATAGTSTLCSGAVSEVGSSSTGTTAITWGSNDFIFFVTAPGQLDSTGNFLVDALDANTASTPEPGTLLLFGTALIGLGLVSKQFRGLKALR